MPQQGILDILNLEDTPPIELAPSRLRDGKNRKAWLLYPCSPYKTPRCVNRVPPTGGMCSTQRLS